MTDEASSSAAGKTSSSVVGEASFSAAGETSSSVADEASSINALLVMNLMKLFACLIKAKQQNY